MHPEPGPTQSFRPQLTSIGQTLPTSQAVRMNLPREVASGLRDLAVVLPFAFLRMPPSSNGRWELSGAEVRLRHSFDMHDTHRRKFILNEAGVSSFTTDSPQHRRSLLKTHLKHL